MKDPIKIQRTKGFRDFNDLPAVREYNEAERARKEAAKLRKFNMIAISRLEDYVSIGNTETGERGDYTHEGKHLRGEKVLDEEEAGFRIWFQQQAEMSESKARKLWKEKKNKNV